MDLAAFRRLLSSKGQAALALATELRPTGATLLSVHQRLRKQFPEDLARVAVETAVLRQKAACKFTKAHAMYFTREALEQSSGEVISTYRAGRFAAYPRVGDFCCGIGGDLIGLAGVTHAVAIDADPLRLAMAQENLKAYGRDGGASFVAGDLLTVPLPAVRAAFFDPDRRAGGRRHVHPDDYVPSIYELQERLPSDFPLGVKVAPAVPWSELERLRGEAEFISVGGELKECVLWFALLGSWGRRATVLPSAASLYAPVPAPPAPPGPPLAYFYDPDPAVVRSGLVANLGVQLVARPIDPDIAYLTSDHWTPTPFARGYEIEDAMPFHARRLGERLRSLNVGPVTITKRGSAVDVDELRRSWKLTGDESRTVVLTRVLGRPFALIARPVTTAPSAV